ncbi:MAG TPA: carboxypeptidase regulatory-like domain-containing protein [Gemmatimonadaceae bacterium]
MTLGAVAAAQDASGGVVGYVINARDGTPIAFADIYLMEQRRPAFANADGRFRYAGLDTGRVTIRVRRMGFSPATIPATSRPGRTDTVRVRLDPVAIALADVRTRDVVCPNRATQRVDTAVITVLQQVRLNAERSALFADEFPFEATMERTIANEWDAPNISKRISRQVLLVDTITLTGRSDWQYEPGHLLTSVSDPRVKDVKDKLLIPTLADFADDAFQGSHCFSFQGLATMAGQRLVRVDFEPTRDVRGVDVSGSLYLDPRTYEIRQSTLTLERPSPQAIKDIWMVRVDTWFGSAAPFLPVVDSIVQRTTVREAASGRRPSDGRSASETQRRIRLRFLDREPRDTSDIPRLRD